MNAFILCLKLKIYLYKINFKKIETHWEFLGNKQYNTIVFDIKT